MDTLKVLMMLVGLSLNCFIVSAGGAISEDAISLLDDQFDNSDDEILTPDSTFAPHNEAPLPRHSLKSWGLHELPWTETNARGGIHGKPSDRYADGNVPSNDILGQLESRDRYFEEHLGEPLLSGGFGSKSLLGEQSVSCHGKCLCAGTTVDCSGQNLTSLPRGISPSTIKLDLSMNNIQEFHEDDFVNLTNLQELRVVGNKLKTLPKHLLRNNPYLRILNFQGNLFTRAPPFTFQNLTYLQQLFLDSNLIKSVNKSAFRNLGSLKELCLSANQLTSIPVSALRKIRGLQALALNNNQITKIPDDAFKKNVKLIVIQLGNNKINTIEKNAFASLTRLRFLDLNNNEIRNVSMTFSRLEALEELILENNKLSQIPDTMFINTWRLETLKLDHNPIKSVSSFAFVNLPSLQELKLSEVHNMAVFPNLTGTMNLTKITLDRANIRYIPNDLCIHLEKISVLDVHSNKIEDFPLMSACKKLTILNMANNLLKSLAGQPFKGMDNLIDLTLNTNFITSIPQDAFIGLTTLEYLNLAENEIGEIHPEAFLPLKKLKDLNLGKNKLTRLPTAGLNNLEKLKVFYNPTLTEFPSKEHFRSVNHFTMAYAYHCCDFIHSRQEQIYLDMIREYVIWMKDGEPEHVAMWENYSNLSRLWSDMLGPSNISVDDYLLNNFDNITFENGNIYDQLGNDIEVSDLLTKSEASTNLKEYASQPNYFVAKAAITCKPMPGPFMPCDDLFGWWSLRCGVWFVFLLAVLGNGIVFFVSVTSKSKMDVPRFLICNLAMADFLMGIYLGMLAIVDASTLGNFKRHAIQWQMSSSCLVAGVLGVLSSELSVFTLTVITLERFYAITHAMQLNKRLSLKHAACIMLGGWMWSFSLAMMPLFGISDYRKFAVCLPFEIEDIISKSYVCFIMIFNGISFFIILSCYLIMYISIRDSQAWNSNDTRVAKRMALLVFTDFLCWAPIALLSLAAAFGKNLIHLNEAKVLTIFVLPLNSCANPFLYAFFTKQFKRDCVLLCRRLEDSSIARHFSQGSQRQASFSWKQQRRLSGLNSLMGEGKLNNSPNGSSGSNSYGLINYNSEVSSGSNRKDSGGCEKCAYDKSKSVINVSSNGHKYKYKICPGDDDDIDDIELILKRSLVKSYKCNEWNNLDAHIILHQDFYSHSNSSDINGGTSETYIQEKDDIDNTLNFVSDSEDHDCCQGNSSTLEENEIRSEDLKPAVQQKSISSHSYALCTKNPDSPLTIEGCGRKPPTVDVCHSYDSKQEVLPPDCHHLTTVERQRKYSYGEAAKISSSEDNVSQELEVEEPSASKSVDSNHLSDSGNGGDLSSDSSNKVLSYQGQEYEIKPGHYEVQHKDCRHKQRYENLDSPIVGSCEAQEDSESGLSESDQKKHMLTTIHEADKPATGNTTDLQNNYASVKTKPSCQKKKHSRKQCHRHHKINAALREKSTKGQRNYGHMTSNVTLPLQENCPEPTLQLSMKKHTDISMTDEITHMSSDDNLQ